MTGNLGRPGGWGRLWQGEGTPRCPRARQTKSVKVTMGPGNPGPLEHLCRGKSIRNLDKMTVTKRRFANSYAAFVTFFHVRYYVYFLCRRLPREAGPRAQIPCLKDIVCAALRTAGRASPSKDALAGRAALTLSPFPQVPLYVRPCASLSRKIMYTCHRVVFRHDLVMQVFLPAEVLAKEH